VLDVFPSTVRVAKFIVYDDDGHTYDYEKGAYFRQEIDAKGSARSVEIALDPATGTYQAHFPSYVLQVHQVSDSVTSDGAKLKRFLSESAFRSSADAGWFTTSDKFGALTEVRVPVDAKRHAVKLARNAAAGRP
jgi:hypothetical protein